MMIRRETVVTILIALALLLIGCAAPAGSVTLEPVATAALEEVAAATSPTPSPASTESKSFSMAERGPTATPTMAPSATPTERPSPTSTPPPPSPTATSLPPTLTPTSIPPTATEAAPTATAVPPTASLTQPPPTATPAPPSLTEAPTASPAPTLAPPPPTATPEPPPPTVAPTSAPVVQSPAQGTSRPARLLIPRIGVDTVVVGVGQAADGSMAAPDGVWEVGWYTLGVEPGQMGNAVISGHFDDYKQDPAVFWRLHELQVGDSIYVVDGDGTEHEFIVTGKEVYPYNQAPLQRIFGLSVASNLNLITCNGTWDAGAWNYDKRLVVYSRLASEMN